MTYLSIYNPKQNRKDYVQIIKNTFKSFNENDFVKFLQNEMNCCRLHRYTVDKSYSNRVYNIFI